MKVGDYIRINNGQIAKIIKIKEYKKWSNIIYTNIAIDLHEDRTCNENQVDEEDIIKSSPNIIDLIEAGDYVNGYLVKYVDNNGVYIDIPFVDSESIGCNVDLIRVEEIENIVTKEQFESMEYKVVE